MQVLLPGPRGLRLIYLLFFLEYHVRDGVPSSSLKCFPAYKPTSQPKADRKHKTLGLQGWSQRKQHAPVHMFGVRCPLQTVACPTEEEPWFQEMLGFHEAASTPAHTLLKRGPLKESARQGFCESGNGLGTIVMEELRLAQTGLWEGVYLSSLGICGGQGSSQGRRSSAGPPPRREPLYGRRGLIGWW